MAEHYTKVEIIDLTNDSVAASARIPLIESPKAVEQTAGILRDQVELCLAYDNNASELSTQACTELQQ